ncbi:MAG: hypothetical protein P8Y60_11685 [Calditrichota bacterium]
MHASLGLTPDMITLCIGIGHIDDIITGLVQVLPTSGDHALTDNDLE